MTPTPKNFVDTPEVNYLGHVLDSVPELKNKIAFLILFFNLFQCFF